MKAVAIIWMLVFLFWLPIEDTQIGVTVALALAFCTLLAVRFIVNQSFPHWSHTLVVGAGLGALLPLLTIFLMAFKSGLHAHGFADFTLNQLLLVVYSIPFTVLIGAALPAVSKLISHSEAFNIPSLRGEKSSEPALERSEGWQSDSSSRETNR